MTSALLFVLLCSPAASAPPTAPAPDVAQEESATEAPTGDTAPQTDDALDNPRNDKLDDGEPTAPDASAVVEGTPAASGAKATSDEERERRARELYAAGSAAYLKGRYAVAIDAFEEALRLVDATPVFFSCAQAHRLQYFIDSEPHHLERAVALYRRYMDVAPEGTRRDHAGQHLAVLGPLLEQIRLSDVSLDPPAPPPARLIVTANAPEATITLDDGDPQSSPATFTTRPGAHVVRVAANGFVASTTQAIAVEGAAVAVPVELQPAPGTLDVRAPDGATVFIDGARAAAGRHDVLPGRHRVTVLAHGREPFVADTALEAGDVEVVEADLEVTAQSWVGYSAIAGAAALLTVATVPGVALGAAVFVLASMQVELQRRALTVDEARLYQGVEGSVGWLGAASAVLITGAVATALLGGAVVFLDEPEEPAAAPASRARPGPAAAPF